MKLKSLKKVFPNCAGCSKDGYVKAVNRSWNIHMSHSNQAWGVLHCNVIDYYYLVSFLLLLHAEGNVIYYCYISNYYIFHWNNTVYN